ncbi:MAG: hypothetical protein EP330_19050 [Deltaproteobacteria bacterium]|nr:MAG: hypothetical protein EP330_19050 [Deltaproteobacteria bacterium]
MTRFVPALLLLSACTTDATLGLTDDDLDGSMLRIVEPRSAEFLELESEHRLVAELTDAAGDVIEFDEIVWTTDVDTEWTAEGVEIADAALAPGMHEITAEVILPNGDRLAHTIGGVRVQSRYAGTYAGLFSANVETQGVQAPCSGSAVVVVGVTGETATGDAACVAGLQGFELDLAFIIDLINNDGQVDGVAAADLFGFFQYDFPAEGTLDPEGEGLNITFGGNAFDQVIVDGRIQLPRVSLESE